MNNENTLFYKIFGGLFALLLVLVPSSALAADIYNNTATAFSSTATDIVDPVILQDILDTPVTVDTMSLFGVQRVSSFPGSTLIRFQVFNDGSGGTYGTGAYDCYSQELSADAWNAVTYPSTPVTLAPDAVFTGTECTFTATSGTSMQIKDNDPSNQVLLFQKAASTSLARALVVDGVPPVDGATPSAPLTGATVGSPVLFTGTYNNGATFDQLIFRVLDVTDSNEQSYTLSLSLVNGVSIPYSYSIPLTLNHSYEYQVWLRDSSDGSVSDSSDFEAFDTSDGVVPTPPIAPEICDDSGLFPDFPCIFRNALIWAFIPDATVLNSYSALKSTFSSSFPFAYVSDLLSLFEDGTGTPETLPTVAVETGFGAPIEIVSQSSIENVIPTDVADFMKGLLTMALWVGLALYVYTKVKGLMTHKS